MSQAGAKAMRRNVIEREFAQHAKEISEKVAAAFQPVYERVCRERDVARDRVAVMQTALELIATAGERVPDWRRMAQCAQDALDQLGIVPDVQTESKES